jgi:hypothetical protein
VGAGTGDVLEQAHRWIAAQAPAVSGQGRHDATFAVACVLVLGLNLTPNAAYPLLAAWNGTCSPNTASPSWIEAMLWHKLADADKKGDTRGYLIRQR